MELLAVIYIRVWNKTVHRENFFSVKPSVNKNFFPGEMIGKYGYERIYFIVENVLFCFVDRVFARICRLF